VRGGQRGKREKTKWGENDLFLFHSKEINNLLPN
jgi:hypothetical protein